MGRLAKGLMLGAAGLAAYGATRRYLERPSADFYRGKRAVVTGGASGIGLAVVEALLARGASVMAVDVDERALDRLAGAYPGVETLAVDVAADGASDRIVGEAVARLGGIDAVFANAGVAWAGPFATMPEEEIDKVVAVNYVAQVKLTRAVLPLLLRQRGGVIAYTGSLSAHVYSPMFSVYTGTKGGLKNFVLATRRELPRGSGVQLSIIHPNFTRTNLAPQATWDDLASLRALQSPPQVAAALLDGVALGRREIFVELADVLFAWVERAAPVAVDYLIGLAMTEQRVERISEIEPHADVAEGAAGRGLA